jgi:hypothetical protein
MTDPSVDYRNGGPSCRGCGQAIDPGTCWCGEWHHGGFDLGHSFRPMGCACGYDRSPPRPPEPEMAPHEMPEGRFLDALRRLRGLWTI